MGGQILGAMHRGFDLVPKKFPLQFRAELPRLLRGFIPEF
jgi:hypothetical protein